MSRFLWSKLIGYRETTNLFRKQKLIKQKLITEKEMNILTLIKYKANCLLNLRFTQMIDIDFIKIGMFYDIYKIFIIFVFIIIIINYILTQIRMRRDCV